MKYLKKFEQTPEYTEYMSGGGGQTQCFFSN